MIMIFIRLFYYLNNYNARVHKEADYAYDVMMVVHAVCILAHMGMRYVDAKEYNFKKQ